ncbi:hypothetical protein [Echinicola arenosa]|uniref:hypothetical protein n=1 Tax=Echinicola arenosa TaxID=2774144 RepID=UPI001CDD1F4E|nr:hypothetical protein [Echinicola arenosa]
MGSGTITAIPLLLVIVGFGIISAGLIFGHGAEGHLISPTGPLHLIDKNKHALSIEHFITPFGALVVSLGHYINWHYIKKSKTGCAAGGNLE